MNARVFARLVTGIVLLALVLAVFLEGQPLLAQTATGATLTVLRGAAAVRKADGTPLSPAPTGLTIGVGDQVASLANSSALITFFDGSELELGADTALIIQEMASQGGRTTIAVQSVFGATLHRVVTLTDPNSTYRVEAGGTVASSVGPTSRTTTTHPPATSRSRSRLARSTSRPPRQTVNAGEFLDVDLTR